MQKSDDRHRRLLRARDERPRDRTSSDKRDEIAPPHASSPGSGQSLDET
jgi:hypothetical protein